MEPIITSNTDIQSTSKFDPDPLIAPLTLNMSDENTNNVDLLADIIGHLHAYDVNERPRAESFRTSTRRRDGPMHISNLLQDQVKSVSGQILTDEDLAYSNKVGSEQNVNISLDDVHVDAAAPDTVTDRHVLLPAVTALKSQKCKWWSLPSRINAQGAIKSPSVPWARSAKFGRRSVSLDLEETRGSKQVA